MPGSQMRSTSRLAATQATQPAHEEAPQQPAHPPAAGDASGCWWEVTLRASCTPTGSLPAAFGGGHWQARADWAAPTPRLPPKHPWCPRLVLPADVLEAPGHHMLTAQPWQQCGGLNNCQQPGAACRSAPWPGWACPQDQACTENSPYYWQCTPAMPSSLSESRGAAEAAGSQVAVAGQRVAQPPRGMNIPPAPRSCPLSLRRSISWGVASSAYQVSGRSPTSTRHATAEGQQRGRQGVSWEAEGRCLRPTRCAWKP